MWWKGKYVSFFRVAEVLPIQHLMENLLWNMVTETQNRRELNQLTFALLFMQLINYTGCLQYTTETEQTVFSVLRYIEEYYRDGSLNDLASQLHYAPGSLSREIKTKTGKTYTELLQDKRMAQATWLLRNTRKGIAEIAVDIGYENVSYFHKLFFNRFGISPKKYRDRCK